MWYFARSFGVKAGVGRTLRERKWLEGFQSRRELAFDVNFRLTIDREESTQHRGEPNNILEFEC